MLAKLTAFVSYGTPLPFELIDDEGELTANGWTHHRATLKSDKSPVSVFKLAAGMDARKLETARHGIKSLRMLRHPNIVGFRESTEAEDKGATTVYLVTEPVRTLVSVLADVQFTDEQKNEYLSMGIRQIACACSFLNNDCRQVHGNISMRSIVVSRNLDWKVSCMDYLSDHASLSSSFLRDNLQFIKDVYKCPEMSKQDWDGLMEGPPYGVDSWGMGCLIREVFGNELLDSPSSLRQVDCIPHDLLKDYQRLLGSQSYKRLNPQKLLKSKHLNNELVDVVNFLENLAIKETSEKTSFFKRLTQIQSNLPKVVVHLKILPMVIDALEFGSASPNALGCVMKIGDEMTEEQFKEIIIPAIIRFFKSSDRTIRRVLLENIDKFGNRLDSKLVDETIYPSLSNGFSDSNAYLRELTLKSMQHFAPKLSQSTLNQSLLKFLAKLQVDPEPSIRANTTVLLGFIAEYLGEASCKRILLNAFSRALRDQFAPARLAALKALATTKKYYSVQEVATKVIPTLSPLAIDQTMDVKQSALRCLEIFIQVLKEVGENEEDAPETKETKEQSSSNYMSWAVSSLGLGQVKAEPKETKPDVPRPDSPKEKSPKADEVDRGTKAFSFGSGEGNWDFDDDDFEDEAEVKSPPKRTTSRASTSKESALSDEPDLFGELGMKADVSKEKPPVVRRKPKPMKLGAKKLNVD